MNSKLIKALEPYSGAFLIKVIWGEIEKSEMNAYRQIIHRRLNGKVKFTKLETSQIIDFLKEQRKEIDSFLNCV